MTVNQIYDLLLILQIISIHRSGQDYCNQFKDLLRGGILLYVPSYDCMTVQRKKLRWSKLKSFAGLKMMPPNLFGMRVWVLLRACCIQSMKFSGKVIIIRFILIHVHNINPWIVDHNFYQSSFVIYFQGLEMMIE